MNKNETVNKKINILHVIGGGGIGGRERMLYSQLKEEKYDLDINSSVYFQTPSGLFYDQIFQLNIPIYTYYNNQSYINNLLTALNVFQEFDLLLFHSANWKLLLMGMLSGRKIIFRLSGLYLHINKNLIDILIILYRKISFSKRNVNNSNHLLGNSNFSKAGNSDNIPNYRSATRVLRRWLFIYFLKRYCIKIIVNSLYAKNKLLKDYNMYIKSNLINIVPNGITVMPITEPINDIRKEFNISRDDFLVGTLCRFDIRKRIDRLLEGFLPLKVDKRIKLIIVGGGDNDLEKKFKTFVSNHDMHEQIIFSGYRNDSQDCLKAMNAFVLSSDNESCPNSLIEAMMLRKPSIVFSDSGGPVEIIQNFKTGIIISHQNELADIIRKLMKNPDTSSSLGENARQYIVNQMSINKYKNMYKILYFECINQ